MKIQKDKDIYIVKPSGNIRSWYYCKSYEEALYFAAYFLVGDINPHKSLESFHTTLKTRLNKEFQGNLGDKIDFTGKWFYPSQRYTENRQGKVKYLEVA